MYHNLQAREDRSAASSGRSSSSTSEIQQPQGSEVTTQSYSRQRYPVRSRRGRQTPYPSEAAAAAATAPHSDSPIPESFGSPLQALPLTFFKDQLLTGTISNLIFQWQESGIEILGGSIRLATMVYPRCSNALKTAFETLSLWSLALSDIGRSNDLRSAAMRAYGESLRQIRLATPSTDPSEFEHTLLAIELICLFEVSFLFSTSKRPHLG